MLCEKCLNSEMVKEFVNTVQLPGYSTIVKFTCPECDYSYKQVA